MSARRLEQTKPRTRLARWRLRRGLTQRELWEATGLSKASYLRIEHGIERNPRVRHLVNLAIALDCQLDDLIEDDWRHWLVLDRSRAPAPPDHDRFWRDGMDAE